MREMSALRARVLERYLSSHPLSRQAMARGSVMAYVRAYRYYLRGWVPAGQGRCWLDVGCGQGALMALAREAGYAVRGVDLSEEVLAVCRDAGLEVQRADALEHLSGLAAGSLDVVSAFDLLEHFDKDDGFALLQQLRRVLGPGGFCLLKLPNAESPWGHGVTAADLTHEASYAPGTLRQIAELAGFAEVRLRELGPAPVTPRGLARAALWPVVRGGLMLCSMVETGSGGSGVCTRNMLARLQAP